MYLKKDIIWLATLLERVKILKVCSTKFVLIILLVLQCVKVEENKSYYTKTQSIQINQNLFDCFITCLNLLIWGLCLRLTQERIENLLFMYVVCPFKIGTQCRP